MIGEVYVNKDELLKKHPKYPDLQEKFVSIYHSKMIELLDAEISSTWILKQLRSYNLPFDKGMRKLAHEIVDDEQQLWKIFKTNKRF